MSSRIPHKRIWIALSLGLVAAQLAAAPEKVVLSLADGGGKYTISADKEYQIEFHHRLPGASYTFEVNHSGLQTPFDVGLFDLEASNQTEHADDDDKSQCDDLIASLADAPDEAALRGALARAKADSPDPACGTRIGIYEAATKAVVPGAALVLAEGQSVHITVTRDGTSKEWGFTLTTGESAWLVHYGFAFLPDRNDEFFTESVPGAEGEDPQFAIRATGDRDESQFEPVVAFSYRPRSMGPSPWLPRFSAGLGADIEERLVFAGLSWVIGDNVNLFVGAAAHEQTRLAGQYEVGQLLKENLTADQLVEETYDLNLIVGVGFRFNANPFKKKAAATPSGNSNQTPSNQQTEKDAEGEGEGESESGGAEGEGESSGESGTRSSR